MTHDRRHVARDPRQQSPHACAPVGRTLDDRPRPTMDAWERQQIFREMAARQLMNGRLSQRRRKNIVQFAAMLGINAVLAGRLLNEARRLADEQMAEQGSDPSLRLGAELTRSPWSFRTFLHGVGLATGIIVVCWLLREWI